jgi:anaerobic sulfite reductase subunit C
MDWTQEAEAAIKKVPFFVRKKVRTRVEEETCKAGKTTVSLSDVRLIQKRYLSKMSEEVKGYQLETCFGTGGCPNRAIKSDKLLERLEEILKEAKIREFLEERVEGSLKHHHEFRVALADCPNACSQPQIRDMGIIGASEPSVTSEPCSLCHACEDRCKEKAIMLKEPAEIPVIDDARCIRCGKCIGVCPTGTLATGKQGYRVLLGGKLGRHPRLAEELPQMYSEDEVILILEQCIDFYKRKSEHGERFAEIFDNVENLGLKFDSTLNQR